MPEYLAPGVYVEETSFRPRKIEAVDLSTAAFIGEAHRGPTSGPPTLITSLAAFTKRFGDASELASAKERYPNHLAWAVRLFFEHGGRQCHVVRIARPRSGSVTAASFIGSGSGSSATGLAALGDIQGGLLLAAPGSAALRRIDQRRAVRRELLAWCEQRRDSMALLTGAEDNTPTNELAERTDHDSRFSGWYYPWLQVPGATAGSPNQAVSAEGAIAGLIARTDADRGVHTAPANLQLTGSVRGLTHQVTVAEQGVLNPEGINCLRPFPGRLLVWGARTTSRDPEWRYINVSRLLMRIEASIVRSMEWVRAEPNGPRLWTSIRSQIDTFLFDLWRDGALTGATTQEAWFVRCDQTTMTQDDIDAGRLVCMIGVAPVRPAEFLVLNVSL